MSEKKQFDRDSISNTLIVAVGLSLVCSVIVSSAAIVLKPVQELLSHAMVRRSLLVTGLWYGGLQGMFANAGMFYSHVFQLNTAQTGVIILLAGIGSVVGSLVGGRFADSWGKKPVFLLFCALTAVAVLALPGMDGSLYGAVAVHVLVQLAPGPGEGLPERVTGHVQQFGAEPVRDAEADGQRDH